MLIMKLWLSWGQSTQVDDSACMVTSSNVYFKSLTYEWMADRKIWKFGAWLIGKVSPFTGKLRSMELFGVKSCGQYQKHQKKVTKSYLCGSLSTQVGYCSVEAVMNKKKCGLSGIMQFGAKLMHFKIDFSWTYDQGKNPTKWPFWQQE